jgi:predicted ArsR family transcriptional regulator
MRREGEAMTDDNRDRTKKGRYVEQVTPNDTLGVFTDHEPRTSKEVADELDVSRRTALNKLTELVERGDLKRKKVGGRAVVFWRPELTRDPEAE